MGTNYFLYEDVCKHCGQAKNVIHIGKSSAGWCFLLHVDEWEEINTLDDWIARWSQPNTIIKNEYGEDISQENMLHIIQDRRGRTNHENKPPFMCTSWADFYKRNNAKRGPRNLLRHIIDGVNCVGHGEGTWDYITGEFS